MPLKRMSPDIVRGDMEGEGREREEKKMIVFGMFRSKGFRVVASG